jgi:hypothetical protein
MNNFDFFAALAVKLGLRVKSRVSIPHECLWIERTDGSRANLSIINDRIGGFCGKIIKDRFETWDGISANPRHGQTNGDVALAIADLAR